MELKSILERRRSIRKFKPEPVSEELLHHLLEAARLAPSGSNLQPWRFAIVRSREMREKLALCTYKQSFIREAPVILVCCADRRAYAGQSRRIAELMAAGAFKGTEMENFSEEYQRYIISKDNELIARRITTAINVAIAVEHIVLRATDLGLGTCWTLMFYEERVRALLGLDENLEFLALLPVGYPAQNPAPRPRLSVNEITLGYY